VELILKKYTEECNKKTDINEHLPTLKKYAEESNTIVEMGVRSIVSTWALLAGNPKQMISYDIKNPSNWNASIEEVYKSVEGTNINFKFIEADVLNIKIDNTDLLFIDTYHVYEQLKRELELHADKVNKYIILHDTTLFGEKGESYGRKGLWPAVEEFLEINPNWKIKERFTNNNGLTVLERN